MSRALMSQRCVAAGADQASRAQAPSKSRRALPAYGSELLADHAVDGAATTAAEEDRGIYDREQQRELPAAAWAGEEVSVAGMPIGHDRHLDREHQRERTRQESHRQRGP